MRIPASLRRPLRLLVKRSGARDAYVRFRHRGLRREDVALASYPRSGNTWTRFLLYQLISGTESSFAEVDAGVPYIGEHTPATRRLLPDGGRLIKTHEYTPSLYSRAVYLVRDPRDVILSEHRHQTKFGFYRRPLDDFVDDFVAGRVHGLGTWSSHVERWLDASERDDQRVIVVRFEALRSDAAGQLARIAAFLGLDADPDRLEFAIEASSLARMRKAEDRSDMARVNPEIRHISEGKVGGWSERLTAGQQERIERAAGPVMERLGYLSS